MDNDQTFLQAIAGSPNDHALRLAYADWLEAHGDSRAEFLRLQTALNDKPHDEAVFRELCEQEQDLVRQFDPSWIQRVRRHTTAVPCRDISKLVPELIPFAQTTTRLHPHRAIDPLPERVSKIGGRFLWPASEDWPSCSTCNVALAPVLQLRQKDAPNISFPAGRDLLQLFWCPDETAHDYEPAPQIWWRSSKSVTNARTDDPDLSKFPREAESRGYIPFECAVYPERVVEYPVGDDLYCFAGDEEAKKISELIENIDVGPSTDLQERFESYYGPGRTNELVFYELAQCPGSKLGGKPSFTKKGQRFDHLVTLSTWEFDSASFRRWLSCEDQRLLSPPGEPLTWVRLFEESEFRHLQQAIGMQLGRTQRAHVFVCREKEPWDVLAYISD